MEAGGGGGIWVLSESYSHANLNGFQLSLVLEPRTHTLEARPSKAKGWGLNLQLSLAGGASANGVPKEPKAIAMV